MKILSLFNGISAMHLALDRADIKYNTVYYAEIDKYANQVTAHHFPQDVPLGDVTKWREWDIDWSSIGLVGAGFPCQAWSVAGKQLGDKDERGMLFWTTLDIIAHVLKHNPNAKFLMENVKMKKDFEEYITHHTTQALGYVEKTLINSALVSAQNRNRYYWTNFKIEQPQDKGILLRDVLESDVKNIYKELKQDIKNGIVLSEQKLNGESQTLDRAIKNGKSGDSKANSLTACAYKWMGTNGMTNVLITGGAIRGRYNADGSTSQKLEINKTGKTNTLTTVQKDNVVVFNNETATSNGKAYTLTASYGGAVAWNSAQKKQRTMVPVEQRNDDNPNTYNGLYYRKLTPTECARLQTFPDVKKCVNITYKINGGFNEWYLEHQKKNANVGILNLKSLKNVLSVSIEKKNQLVNVAEMNLNTNPAEKEKHVQNSVLIRLEGELLLVKYQEKLILSVSIADHLKKCHHPIHIEDFAHQLAVINSILAKTMLCGKVVQSTTNISNSTNQQNGKTKEQKYTKEMEDYAEDAVLLSKIQENTTSTTLGHASSSQSLNSQTVILFYCVLNVIDLCIQEEIQEKSLLNISLEMSNHWASIVSNTQAYKAYGNAWTVDVIAHILKHI